MKLNKIALALAISLVAGNRVTQAAVIYYDNFSGTAGALAGRTPTVDVGSNTWAADSVFSTDGSKVVVSGNASGVGESAYLPFSPQSGFIYALSVNLSPTAHVDSNAADWLSMGFGSFVTTSQFHAAPNVVGPWLLTTNAPNTTYALRDSAADIVNTTTATGPTNYEIILNTTGAQWTAAWFYNNSQFASYTYPTNPTISGVAIGSYRENGLIDNFELQTVPEPSACLLLLLGLAGLRLSRRKRS